MWQSFVLVAVLLVGYFIIKAKKANKAKQEQPRQQQAVQQKEEGHRVVGKLSGNSDLGKMIFLALGRSSYSDLLEVLDVAENRDGTWQAVFIKWLMHYTGKGVAADPVENKDINTYLKNGLFQKARDMAPPKHLSVFWVYLGSGINCMSLHADDPDEKIRMRGLFHAAAAADFTGGKTLLFDTAEDEAKFWHNFFAGSFPGVDDRDPEKEFMKSYFRAFVQEEYAQQIRQECEEAIERSSHGEQALLGDDLKLLVANLDSGTANTFNRPCKPMMADKSTEERRFPLVSGAFQGNAACMYICCMEWQFFSSALEGVFRDHFGHDLEWGAGQLKALLEAQEAKGDPRANHYLEELERNR